MSEARNWPDEDREEGMAVGPDVPSPPIAYVLGLLLIGTWTFGVGLIVGALVF